MSTHTNAVQPEKKIDRKTQLTVILVLLVLITTIVMVVTVTNQPAVVLESRSPVAYSNALEMQYAQPWIDAQNKSAIAYSNALEMQYAQPWIQDMGLFITVTGRKVPFDCHSTLETLYACRNGYGVP